MTLIHSIDSLFFSGTIDVTDSSIDIVSGLSSSIDKEPSAVQIPFSSVSIPTANANKRIVNGASSARSSKPNKRKKTVAQSDSSSSSNESDVDDSTQQVDARRTPSFAGRRVTSSATSTNHCPGDSIDKDSYLKFMEKKYFIPLSIAQERLEKMMKSLYKNQTKIQKALQKRQVRIKLSFV